MAKLDEKFFYKHAGWGYTPGKETEEQGRKRGARALAKAYAKAHEEGYTFEWQEDADADREGIDHDEMMWGCILHAPDGENVGSLWGIDFAEGEDPWSSPYARVVEAELASEELE